jgi:hypothetical protein
MEKIVRALKQAAESCLDLRILALLFVPFFLALIIAVILFFALGSMWLTMFSSGLQHSALGEYLSQKWQLAGTVSSVSYFVTLLLMALLVLPVSYLLSIIIVSIALMPMILKILDEKGFSVLQKKHGGTLIGNVWNTVKASVIYLILLVVTLPMWIFPGFALCLPILFGSYLNKKVFVYDVLEDYASLEEMQMIEKQHRASLYGLGIILGTLNYLPLTFVVMPVFAGLAYSYFCLNALKELRDNRPTS